MLRADAFGEWSILRAVYLDLVCTMPNIATTLKSEISRLARKELRLELAGLRKAHAALRADIAALKRILHGLEKSWQSVKKAGASRPQPLPSESAAPKTRYSAKSLAAQRRRLGLSAAECGLLIGTSGQAIYNWETAKARPNAANLAAVAALRTLGRKDAAALVAARR